VYLLRRVSALISEEGTDILELYVRLSEVHTGP
jgi:hypothetical protein